MIEWFHFAELLIVAGGVWVALRMLRREFEREHELHLATIFQSVRRFMDTATPPAGVEVVEVVSPDGDCKLYGMPSRPDEPVHPEIQRALHTPGWKIRYPDGRVELGVQ